MYSDQEREKGGSFDGGGFDGSGFGLGFFGGLLHSPLGDFVSLRHRSHPSLKVSMLQILLLLNGCGGGSILNLCQGNIIDKTHELPIPVNLKQSEM